MCGRCEEVGVGGWKGRRKEERVVEGEKGRCGWEGEGEREVCLVCVVERREEGRREGSMLYFAAVWTFLGTCQT